MKKVGLLLAAFALGSSLSAQKTNEKVIVVNSGKFEFSAPFTDYVTVGSFNPFTKTYKVFDTISSQSAQSVLLDEKTGFVLAENTIAKYNFQTETKMVSGIYHGVSPRSMTLSGNTLLVGNWYGQVDSFLYAYNATTLALNYVVKNVEQEAKAILAVGDTAYVAQNIPGTIDNCAPYGCFNDSIGYIALVQISTGAFLGNVVLGDTAAGISALYKYGNSIVTVNRQARTISVIDIASQIAQTYAVAGTVGKGIALVNDDLYFLLNGKAAKFSLISYTVTATNLSAINYPVAIALEPISNTFYETKTDYTSYGSLVSSKSGIVKDSISVGISPESIGLYYSINEKPIALDDNVMMNYSKDTLIDVLSNDMDSTFAPLKVTFVSSSLVFGATASIDSATGKILYTPAPGIETLDTLTYVVCDVAGVCDTATIYFLITGITAINDVAENNYSIYPNPFSNRLYISGLSEPSLVQVWNITGQQMLETTLKTNEALSLAELPKGMYILRVNEKNTTFTFRAVKN